MIHYYCRACEFSTCGCPRIQGFSGCPKVQFCAYPSRAHINLKTIKTIFSCIDQRAQFFFFFAFCVKAINSLAASSSYRANLGRDGTGWKNKRSPGKGGGRRHSHLKNAILCENGRWTFFLLLLPRGKIYSSQRGTIFRPPPCFHPGWCQSLEG